MVSKLTLLKASPSVAQVERLWVQLYLDQAGSYESVTPNGASTNSLADYLPYETTYYYCWDAVGGITRQDEVPAPC